MAAAKGVYNQVANECRERSINYFCNINPKEVTFLQIVFSTSWTTFRAGSAEQVMTVFGAAIKALPVHWLR